MKRAHRLAALLVACAGLLAAPCAAAQDSSPLDALSADERAAVDSITAATIMPTIRFLASNELEGREAGERGLRIAAAYVTSRFQAIGLEGGGKNGFRQGFDLRWRVLSPDAELTVERKQGGGVVTRSLELRRDFMPFGFSDEGQVEAPIVFAGYGIVAPEHGWNDYARVGPGGVRGKIVLIFRHEPDEEGERGSSWFDGREMTLHASLRQKARLAAEQGAAGLIIVDDPLHHEVLEKPSTSLSSWRTLTDEQRQEKDAWFRGRPGTRDGHPPLGIVAAHASQELLTWLDRDRDWKDTQRQVDAGKRVRVQFPGVTATMVHGSDARYRRTENVLGLLRGSDPELSKEYVLVGGHYDHVGKDEESGDIYNGADDNASGTATVIAVAEAFTRLAERPARSVIFAAWAAEEKGLLGSNWFVHHPPVELGDIVAAINLDMVGRNEADEMSVVGRTETPDLVEIFDRFAPATSLTLNDDAGAGASRSDNASLWLAGVPTASLFSGTHDDYHQPGDTAGKIVPGKVEAAARLTFLVANEMVQGRVTPEALKVPRGPWEPVAPESRLVDRGAGDEKP